MSGNLILRRGVVVGRQPLRVRISSGPLGGEECAAFHPGCFGELPGVGDLVVVNTAGVEMGLGTGGVVFLVPGVWDGEDLAEVPVNEDHFMKLPYTPLQFPAKLPESGIVSSKPLAGVPVVVLPLHSHLAVACCAAKKIQPGASIAFVWQEGGALPVAFSKAVSSLKERGLLSIVVSSGSCFGGDMEAPNIYSALEVAAGYDIVLVGIGPGVVGTATRYGHGGMSAATALNAAVALGGRPVLVPRLSGADERERHRGMSHHTRAVLGVTLAGVRVALPASAGEIAQIPEPHLGVAVEASAAGLEAGFGLTFSSMGRNYRQDEVFFDAAAAGVALALGDAEGTGERERA